ncbi:BTAD domain-containing putative transcriptional regulator [Micromonospora sp. LOL_023]|uniref:BTAD domain-containing putative transcriptional regulator n=1 Tax=Micromonospora sp. LOL_023 TaxID=3345418 RepID=UPI003A8C43B7
MFAFLAATARRLAGLALLVLLTAGVPYALIRYVGWPLPAQVPTMQDIGTALTSPLTDTMLGNLIVCLLWVAWAAWVWSLIAELFETVAGIRLPQPAAIAPARGLAALLVAAITGGVLATAAQAAPTLTRAAEATGHSTSVTVSTAPAANTISNTTSAAVFAEPLRVRAEQPATLARLTPTAAGETVSAQLVAGQMTLVSAGQTYTCEVKHGDTLSAIAQEWLGDANRWPEIFALNRGTHFSDVGGTLTNPNLIYPGWTLELPDDATPPAGAPSRTGPPPADPDATGPHQPAPATAPPASTQPPYTDQPPSANPSPSSTAAVRDGDDGVVEPEPPAAPAAPDPSPTAGTAAATPETPSEQQAPPPGPEPSPGVLIGTGSWLDLGLVAAILGAVALVWAHRRRRYAPRPPAARLRLDDPTVEPMPEVVTRIRRGLRRPTPTREAVADTPLDELITHPDADEPDATDGVPAAAQTATPPEPVTPALASPVMEVWPPAGLGLTGPGAEAAARGFLVSALAAGGLDEPNGRGYVVIPSGTLATLLGAAAVTVPDTPRLTVTGGLTDALMFLEEQTLHRTRVCFDYEVDTITGLRDADPMAEPLPPLVLIADTTAAHERARIAALLAQGQRLDIHGILLGAWPDGDTVVVADDGVTSPAEGDANRHGRHPADVGRLTVIDPTEAADLLRVLAESHTGEPQPPAPAERAAPPTPDAEPADVGNATVHNDDETAPPTDPTEPDDAPATTSPPDHRPDDGAVVESPADDDRVEPEKHATAPPDDGDDAATGRVEVRVLGDAHVVDIDTTQPLRGKSLELLVYLAARGGTTSQEAILEDLLPEATSSKAPHRLHTYVYNLRRVLKRTGGPATYLSHPGRRYILHRDTVDVDLWRMSDALDEANRAADPADRTSALRRAVNAYQGPLADSKEYEWIEPYREAVQRQAVDAALALAEELDDQPADALAVLTTAIGHSPYAETLYQAAMRAHAALGDPAAIRDLQRQLARSLDEIDTEASDETTALARALVNRLQRGPRVGGEGKAPP